MIYLENGILLNLFYINSVKRIVIDDIHCFRLEIHYHENIVCFDYSSLCLLDNDYEKIKNSLERVYD